MDKIISKEMLAYAWRNKMKPSIEKAIEPVSTEVEGIKTTLEGKFGKPENEGTVGQVLTKTEDGSQWMDAQGGNDLNIENGYVSAAYEGKGKSIQQKDSTASGWYSVALGSRTQATNEADFAEGYGTIASGGSCHAEGYYTKAIGFNGSHAEGYYSVASGSTSHAEGNACEAIGMESHAEGNHCKATASQSHAEGYYCEANGYQSHAEGYFSVTNNYGEHAEGTYNKSNSGDAGYTRSSIGIGSSNTDRKNAFEVMYNGDVYVYGIGGYDGTNPSQAQTLQQVINGLPQLVGNYIQSITQEGGMIKYTSTNFRTGNSDENQINFKTINGQSVFGVDDIKTN